jgi:hypothetical protein
LSCLRDSTEYINLLSRFRNRNFLTKRTF